ncbi:unnamed protein product [Urochloa decumbens]|uniref:HMG box domain-containing protein n=1 Tax=Urochloa decumbens TaxID=240449 RepID=A0ABC9B822_9POAL
MEMKRSARQPLQSGLHLALPPPPLWQLQIARAGQIPPPRLSPILVSLHPVDGRNPSIRRPPSRPLLSQPPISSSLLQGKAKQSQADPISSMAGGKSTGNAARTRKRVEATVLKRSRDGSAFTRCEACNKDVPVVLIDMHSCSLDAKIRMTLEAQVVEKTVEVTAKADRKKPATKGGAANKDSKRKRTPTAFFLFLEDFRKEFKAANPDNKSVSTAAKEAGEKWRSMTDQEKKPYVDKATELKALAENGEGSGENNVADEKAKADDTEGDKDQEVDQPAKRRRRRKVDDEDEAGDQEDEDEKNELEDDLDDDM